MNSVPNNVVHAESTNVFTTKLDKFRRNQEIYHDYHSELQGIGLRSYSCYHIVHKTRTKCSIYTENHLQDERVNYNR